MGNNPARIDDKNNHYIGDKESITRLKMLYNITKINLYNYVKSIGKYEKYFLNELDNITNNGKNPEKFNEDVFLSKKDNDILKINCKLFNLLSSFDSLRSYIYSILCKKETFEELNNFVDTFDRMLNGYCENTKLNYGDFLHEARNSFIHNGRPISKFDFIHVNNRIIPKHVILVDQVWPLQHAKNRGIPDKNYCIDTFETFTHIKVFFTLLKKCLTKLK